MAPRRSASTTVVVLGGGIGGVSAARRLRRLLGREHRVILVSRDERFRFDASNLWVMTGSRRAEQIARPLSRLAHRGIDVVVGEVTAIDPVTRTVELGSRQLSGDYLVVSLGADYRDDQVPGLATHGQSIATVAGAQRLHEQVERVERGRVVVLTAAPLYRCPAAPYESALLIDARLRERGVRDRVEVVVHAAEPAPMGVAGPNVSAGVVEMLATRGIEYVPSHQVVSVEDGVAHFSDAEVTFDVLAYMPGIAPPRVVAESALAGEGGWIAVDRGTLSTDFPGVFAIGDNVQIPLSIGKPLPKAGVFAHAQGRVVAENIARDIAGRERTGRFDGHGACFIETGEGRAGFGGGNFYAEPGPSVQLRRPSRRNHWGKVLFEKEVLWRWVR